MHRTKNIIIGGLTLGLLGAGGTAIYLVGSNSSLQASMIEIQQQNEARIQGLETELKNVKNEEGNDNALTIGELLSGQQATGTLSEEEVLKEFFAETPTPINQDLAENEDNSPINGPNLAVNPETLDLGTLSKSYGEITATFDLKNEGTKDLSISYALSSCGCTTAPLPDGLILKPGDSYPLEITYDPNFYGADYELGDIEKTITIISNDSREPFKKVKLSANVTP